MNLDETRSPSPARPALILALFTLAAFSSSVFSAFVWDDRLYITDNATLARPDGLVKIWTNPHSSPSPYPLVFSALWAQWRLWRGDPVGYKLVNTLLHIATALVGWRVMARLRLPGAWLAAAFFALHPLRVESVAQAAEIKDTLSGVFAALSALYWIKWEESPRARDYALMLVCFTLAMLSKTVICALPAALLVISWGRGARLDLRRWLGVAPLFIIGLTLAAWTIHWEKTRTGAEGVHFVFTLAERFLIAGRSAWFYLGKTIWPTPLGLLYVKWNLNTASPAQWLFPAAGAALIATLWAARSTIGRVPLAATLFYVIVLSPALGFFNYSTMVFSFAMDHYAYLASFGPSALLGAGAARAIAHVRGDGARPRPWFIPSREPLTRVPAGALAALAILTFAQGLRYRNEFIFWSHNVRMNPASGAAHYDYAIELAGRNQLEEALAEYFVALRLEPSHIEAHARAGDTLARLGRIDEALALLEHGLTITPPYPRAELARSLVYGNIGAIRLGRDEVDLAEAALRQAIDIDPTNASARLNLAEALRSKGDESAALEVLAELARRHPKWAPARMAFGQALARAGRPDEAAVQFREAAPLMPLNPRPLAALAAALMDAGRLNESVEAWRAVIDLAPDDADAHNNLGVALARSGRHAEAINAFRKALALKPYHANARANLERAQADFERGGR